VDYWFYYYENGNKKKKAIMKTIKNVNGGFYESNKEVNKKVSLKRPIKCFSLFYKKTTLDRKNILWESK
jgi:hypothetical protein